MKTLKKVLAVVLALAMVLGMAVTASAGYTDDAKITNKEAVAVMSLAGVLNGYTDGSFKPEGTLTRAEAAKMIVYALGLEDTSLGYKANFGDINGHWAETPISVAAGLGIVAGMGNGQFEPNGTLTGFQWAKIILCAMGYDAEIENLVGAGWEAKVAKLMKAVDMDDDLGKFDGSKAVTRENAAQMIFNVLTTGFVGYPEAAQKAVELGSAYYTGRNAKYGEFDCFADRLGITYKADQDAWGRPGTTYYVNEGKKTEEDVFVVDTPVAVYTEAVKKADLLDDLGLKESEFEGEDLYANGVKYDYETLTNLGAQGQLVEIYEVKETVGTGRSAKTQDAYRVIAIDTYLAKVASVVTEKTNSKDKVTRDAYLKLDVFGLPNDQYVKGNDYEKSDYVLVNVNFANAEKVDIEGLGSKYLVEVVGLADSFEGKLEKIKNNVRTIDGTEYEAAAQYWLNRTDYTNDERTYFLDQYGNLIGSAEIADEESYGIVTYFEKQEATRKDAYYLADITFVDETTVTDVKVKADLPDGCALEGTGYDPAPATAVAQELYKITYDEDDDEYTLVEVTAKVEVQLKAKKTVLTENVLLNDDTVFIVRSGKGTAKKPYEFEFITGNDNIEKYPSHEVYYVAEDGYATYVYIQKDPTATVTEFVYVVDGTPIYNSKDKDWTYTGVGVDGEEITFDASTPALGFADGKLYKVTIKDGDYVADSKVEVTAAVTLDGSTAIYAGLVSEFEGRTLTTAAGEFNIDDDTVIIDEDGEVADDAALDALNDPDGIDAKYVYVVYDADDTDVAETVFITDVELTATLNISIENKDKDKCTVNGNKSTMKIGETFTLTLKADEGRVRSEEAEEIVEPDNKKKDKDREFTVTFNGVIASTGDESPIVKKLAKGDADFTITFTVVGNATVTVKCDAVDHN